jgi:hypothetical protein
MIDDPNSDDADSEDSDAIDQKSSSSSIAFRKQRNHKQSSANIKYANLLSELRKLKLDLTPEVLSLLAELPSSEWRKTQLSEAIKAINSGKFVCASQLFFL